MFKAIAELFYERKFSKACLNDAGKDLFLDFCEYCGECGLDSTLVTFHDYLCNVIGLRKPEFHRLNSDDVIEKFLRDHERNSELYAKHLKEPPTLSPIYVSYVAHVINASAG